MTTTHERSQNTPSALNEAERSVFNVRGVEAWRSRQHGTLAGLEEAQPFRSGEYLETFNDSIDDQLDEYLAEQGLDRDDPNYDEIRQAYRDASIDRIHDDVWYTSPHARGEDDNNEPSARRMFAKRVQVRTASPDTNAPDSNTTDSPESDTDTSQPDTDHAETLARLRNQVDTIRAAWAGRTAKRAGKLKTFGKRKEEHDQFERSYHSKVNELGRFELRDQLASDDLSDTEKNAAVISFLFAEQERLREQTTEKLNGTKVGKFIEMMNRGTKMQRVGKAALLGVGFGIGGAMIAGVAGTGLAAGAAVATGRFVRGYTAHDKRGMKKLSDSTTEDAVRQVVESDMNRQSSTDSFDATHAHLSRVYERDTLDQQKKRRNALAMGAGSVALGAAVGYGAFFFGSQGSQILGGPDFQKFHPFGHNDPTTGIESDTDIRNTAIPDYPPGTRPDPFVGAGDTNSGGDSLLGRGELFSGFHGTRAMTPEAVEALRGTMDGYTVKPGDSVWSLSERFLEDRGMMHPTIYEIDATKDVLLADLRANGLVDANGWLTPGDTLRTE